MADINRLAAWLSSGFHAAAVGCVGVLLVVTPWLYASVAMWWFWPMMVILCAAMVCSGLGVLADYGVTGEAGLRRHHRPRRVIFLLASAVPFFLFAMWRLHHDVPGLPLVYREAERSLLLLFTPLVLFAVLYCSVTPRMVRALAVTFLVNATLIAVYTLVVFGLYGDDGFVMWSPKVGYPGRACGPFYCPNHLSAFMNLATCLMLAVVITRRTVWRWRLAALVALVPVCLANYYTLSRGGMISLVLMLPFLLVLGSRGYPWKRRLLVFSVSALLAGGAVAALFGTRNPMMDRFEGHWLYQTVKELPQNRERIDTLRKEFFIRVDRGQYIDSALRAWRSNPLIGIGPGQHPIRWPQFAATEDGDREAKKYPTLTNHDYFLYEVHSDWVQLLEEYGAVGFVLFLIPLLAVLMMLYRAQTQGLYDISPEYTPLEQALPLAGMMMVITLMIHSLGEFALQIPAIVWNMAIMVSFGILVTASRTTEGSYEE